MPLKWPLGGFSTHYFRNWKVHRQWGRDSVSWLEQLQADKEDQIPFQMLCSSSHDSERNSQEKKENKSLSGILMWCVHGRKWQTTGKVLKHSKCHCSETRAPTISRGYELVDDFFWTVRNSAPDQRSSTIPSLHKGCMKIGELIFLKYSRPLEMNCKEKYIQKLRILPLEQQITNKILSKTLTRDTCFQTEYYQPVTKDPVGKKEDYLVIYLSIYIYIWRYTATGYNNSCAHWHFSPLLGHHKELLLNTVCACEILSEFKTSVKFHSCAGAHISEIPVPLRFWYAILSEGRKPYDKTTANWGKRI